MILLALRLALIALWYPLMLILAFEVAHAMYCSLYGETFR
jgi:hypothetical protein